MSARHSRSHLAIFALGLAISAVMVARSQVTIDQYNLLARGWSFAAEGEWVPYGVWATAGGYHPGGMTSLVVGAPLLLWEDHRAPTVLILASHVLAYLLLAAVLRRILSPAELLLFALLYWLSPWRLFFSGFLWNPSFLFVCGALHLWTAFHLRRENSPGWSFAHVLTLGLASQLHVSALLLIVASGLLWWRRYLELHVGGALAAVAVVAASLFPWLLAVMEDPSRLPLSAAGVEEGLLSGVPIVQGVLHWLRLGAAGVSRSMACLDFSGVGGPNLAASQGWMSALRLSLTVPTLLLAIWANARLWWDAREVWRPFEATETDRRWLGGAVRWSAVAALLVFALAPVGLRIHGLLSVVHLAVLPIVLAVGSRVDVRRVPALTAMGGYAAAMVALGIGLAFGTPPYRCGGSTCDSTAFTVPALRSDHRLLDELGIRAACAPVVNDPRGWWPDGLEEAPRLGQTGAE